MEQFGEVALTLPCFPHCTGWTRDWHSWKESAPTEILRPERSWEGADAPLVPSVRSTAYGRVNQLRDPAIFDENGRVYLLYAVAGESGIAIAEVLMGE
jgi:hypothetical protein